MSIVEKTILIFKECGYTEEEALKKIKEIEVKHGFSTEEEATKIYTNSYFKKTFPKRGTSKNSKIDKRVNREYISDEKYNSLVKEINKIFKKYDISYYTLFRDYVSVARTAIKKKKVTPSLYERIKRTLNDKEFFIELGKKKNERELIRIDVKKLYNLVEEYKKKHRFKTTKELSFNLTKDADFITRIFTSANGGSRVSKSRLDKIKKVIGNISNIERSVE